MSDIVERIRSLRYVHVPVASQLFEEAAAEIERLRLQLRERGDKEPIPKETRAEVSYTLCPGVSEYTDGISARTESKPTLTDEEREAIHRAEARLRTAYVPDDETAATLRKLLARLA
jgi:hypothetical protein